MCASSSDSVLSMPSVQMPKKPSQPGKYIVESLDTRTKRVSPGPRCQLAGSCVDTVFRPLRQEHLDFSVERLAPQAKSDEVPFFGSGYGALAWFTFRRMRPSMNLATLAITRRPARSLRT